ncbi:probable G-protein coupled receptor 141 [Brachionichthys hirsutus]|uniref:probable G-protein coupled receptor 141 n=1 Tax=Brachionichthys hirsutus TaxID=412623 RepID=UPI0036048355
MASAGIQSVQAMAVNSTMNAGSVFGMPEPLDDAKNIDEYHTVLLAIYVVVLLSGTINLGLMMHIMKSSTTSITSIAVLNLIFTHFIFLLTVPFRIYYYATDSWSLGLSWCKVFSSMIHIHMYMSFIFYTIILVTRLMAFHCQSERVASYRKMHALLVSAAVWVVVIVVGPCIIFFSYGKKRLDGINGTAAVSDCFRFGENIEPAGKVFNYIISAAIITVTAVLAALQGNVLWVLYRKYHQGCTSQQDFGAQLKGMCFASIMVVCFIPYHLFRVYYMEHIDLQNVNEVFLSLTTFNCLDMLTFLGRRTCYVCVQGRAL